MLSCCHRIRIGSRGLFLEERLDNIIHCLVFLLVQLAHLTVDLLKCAIVRVLRVLLARYLERRLRLLVEQIEELASQLIGELLSTVLEQCVQRHNVALDASVVQAAVEVFGELSGYVRPTTQEQLADARVAFLHSEKQRGQTCQRLVVDAGSSIQKFLHDILVLRIRTDCIHERSTLLLIFMIDQCLVVE